MPWELNGWIATDDRDGQPGDIDAESAKGWERFRDDRDEAIQLTRGACR